MPAQRSEHRGVGERGRGPASSSQDALVGDPLASAAGLLRRAAAWWRSEELPPGRLEPDAGTVRARALEGLVGIALVVLGATGRGSSFVLQHRHAWLFDVTAGRSGPWGLVSLASVLAVWGGLAMLARAWLGLLAELRRRPSSPLRWVVALVGAWSLPLMIAPPLFSRDVYSYAADGAMARAGLDPYRLGPVALGPGTFLHMVDPVWRTTPAPYGPLFLALARWSATLGSSEVGTVALLRAEALAGVVLAGIGLVVLARANGRDPSLALALGVANPLTLTALVAGAHNDALMMGLSMLALAAASRGRNLLGVVLASLATAVKVPGAVVVCFIAWQWGGASAPWSRRAASLASAAAVLAAVLQLAAWVGGFGWGWVHALGVPGSVGSPLTPVDDVSAAVVGLSSLRGNGALAAAALVRDAALLAAALAGAALLLASRRIGSVKALAWSLLALCALGPALQPWYLSWAVLPLAAVAEGPSRRALVACSLAGTFLWLPDAWASLATPGRVGLVALGAVLLAGVAAELRRARRAELAAVVGAPPSIR